MALREREVQVVLRTTSEGLSEYDRNIAKAAALQAEAEALAASQGKLTTSSGVTRRELERMEPSLNNLGKDLNEVRERAEGFRGELERSGVGAVAVDRAIAGLTRTTSRPIITRALIDQFRDFNDGAGLTTREAGVMATAILNAGQDAERSEGFFARLSGNVSGVGDGFFALGRFAIPVAITGLVALGVVLGPLIITLGAFAAGAAAVTVILGTGIGALGLAAAGMAALSIATQGTSGPVGKLISDAKGMADTLGKLATPAVQQMASWLDQLLPKIQSMGEQLEAWFGARLPAALKLGSEVADQAFGALDRLGTGIGKVVDEVLRDPRFMDAFGAGMNATVDAALGLLRNLDRLSDWFLDRLPGLGSTAGNAFGAIGTFIQGFGSLLGRIVDWWLSVSPQFGAAFSFIGTAVHEGLGIIAPVIGVAQAALQALMPIVGAAFALFRDHANEVRGALVAVGVVLGVVFAAILLVVAVLAVITAASAAFTAVLVILVGWLVNHAGPAFSALGATVRNVWASITGATAATWSGVYGTISSWAGRAYNAVTGTFGALAGWIGRAFSGIGSVIRNGLSGARNVINSLISAADRIPGVSIPMMGAFQAGGVVSHPTLAVLGEVAPEFIIPTDPAHRGQALNLLSQAAGALNINATLMPGGPVASARMVAGVATQASAVAPRITNVHFDIRGLSPIETAAAVDQRLSQLLNSV